jgi:oxepin-CoA hydrolase/3-oxo-5,6-dehydrosuberyl-CoA semialdehyde dehydrogenase
MSGVLPSFVNGAWVTPDDPDATVVRDASTGAEVCRVSSRGLDLEGALGYARDVGQRSLGRFTFHQRALLLKQFALALSEHKDELYALSAAAGSTARDAMIDVDGGIGVLFTYSSKGRRELPNAQLIVDGPVEPLSKDGSFSGRHVLTRLPGVAVQINAFNFPMWGPLEKFAPAFLAGVPSIVKPATPTAYVTEAWVRILLDTGLVPEGSLQLISGAIPGLLARLRLGDLVGFTGSASTASRLRAEVPGDVRFTAETDSINASVLGLDAAPGTPAFDAYVRQLFTELTAKTGQKCTAIRRAIVPEDRVEALVEALRTMIDSRVRIGDPRTDGVTMGPLVSFEQRDEVLRSVQRLRDAGGDLLLGAPDAPADADPAGAFVAPMLLGFADATVREAHEVEAFGPVATLLTYRTVEEASDIVARGGGSLVTSLVTDDPALAADFVLRSAAYNGRVLVLSSVNARTSTGHGSPVPHLVHGGPGRAGGGEELGGIRAVLHHMQRSAIQGSPDMLTAITGEWHAGAAADAGGRHPFRKSLAELRIGDRISSRPREVTLADIEHFAEFTGDTV